MVFNLPDAMAAAVQGKLGADNQKGVMEQVSCFLRGSTQRNKLCSDELIESAIFLLQRVPAARQAVLDYLCQLFDEASGLYVRGNELDKKNDESGQRSEFEGVMQQLQSVLHTFIKQNPEVWAPIISTWSIELLGQISCRYVDRRSHMPNLNDQLQQWMTCPSTKILIEIASECFASMVGTGPEVCVDALLEASVKYSPHFDWVVAHIGSCFPRAVINRVLMSGLKDYAQASNGQTRPPDNKVPKMVSVVGILGHLAEHHSTEIHQAFISLFKTSMRGEQQDLYRSAVPFMLQLSATSPVLLRALMINFVNILTPAVLNRLSAQFTLNPPKDPRSLFSLVVNLIKSSDENAFRLLQFLLDMGAPLVSKDSMDTDDHINEVVKKKIAIVLNWLMVELLPAVHNKTSENASKIPFLQALSSHSVTLTKQLAVATGRRSVWVSRLLSCLALETSEYDAASILSTLLMCTKSTTQLIVLQNLYTEISIKYPDLMTTFMIKVSEQLRAKGLSQYEKSQIINNLLTLTKWEQSHNGDSCFPVTAGLQKHLCSFSKQLLSDAPAAYKATVIQLLDIVGLPKNMSVDEIEELCSDWVACFFTGILIGDQILTDCLDKVEMCESCSQCLQKLCASTSFAQKAVLRNLMEGILSQEFRLLFGAKPEEPKVTAPSSLSLSATLERPNKTNLKDSFETANRGTVFHAGVIGQGPKPLAQDTPLPKEQIDLNCQLFTDVLWACCHATKDRVSSNRSSPVPSSMMAPGRRLMSPDFARELALLVIELVTPDCMYNGILWPEEDFMKVTVERDLLIKKEFQNNPIIWDILTLLADGPGALCFCSVLLRSLTSVLIAYWESSRKPTAKDSPWHLEASIKVVELLRKGGLLGAPLCYVGELFGMLTPYEIHLLFLSIWKFLKENPPDPRISKREACDASYTDTLRSIFHANITRMGHLYPRFFTAKHS